VSSPSSAAPVAAAWRVPFVRPDLPASGDLAAVFRRIVESGQVTKGPELASLEADARDVLGADDVVAVSSCSVGLALGLRAWQALHPPAAGSVGRTEVIVPSFTFLAAPAAVVWAGLEPVFVDCDPASWTVSPDAVAAAVGPRTAAILACHTFGCPCDLPALEAIAAQAGVPLMVDAAHALGSRCHGVQVGREGFAQVFSLSATKLVVAGEGGLVATSSPAFAALLRELREYGNDGHYGCTVPGLNGRLPELSAALGRASLARLDQVREARAAAAAAYRSVLSGCEGIGVQAIPSVAESSWKDFSITIDASRTGIDRDTLRAALAERGIDTRAYYSPACHRMAAFAANHASRPALAVTDVLAATSLSLPMGGHVTPDVARDVAGEVLGLMPERTCAR
jgi:dTDP-4-amino-4,6-dideoxygalactose transaminase